MRNQTIHMPVKAAVIACCLFFALFAAAPAFAEETVCLQCHAGQPGHLSEPIGLWEMSVHKKNGVSCHDCHGGDPTDFAMAMSPERGFVGVPSHEDVPAFCGKCHVGVKEDYSASAHGKALAAGGPNCVTCHSNHKVKRASLDLINQEACSSCHDYGRAADMKEALVATDSRIAALEKELEELHDKGIATREMEGRLFALRNEFHRLFHSVDVDLVIDKTDAFRQRLDEIAALASADQEDLGQRKVVGAVIVVLLVLAGILLLMLKKTYEGGD